MSESEDRYLHELGESFESGRSCLGGHLMEEPMIIVCVEKDNRHYS